MLLGGGRAPCADAFKFEKLPLCGDSSSMPGCRGGKGGGMQSVSQLPPSAAASVAFAPTADDDVSICRNICVDILGSESAFVLVLERFFCADDAPLVGVAHDGGGGKVGCGDLPRGLLAPMSKSEIGANKDALLLPLVLMTPAALPLLSSCN